MIGPPVYPTGTIPPPVVCREPLRIYRNMLAPIHIQAGRDFSEENRDLCTQDSKFSTSVLPCLHSSCFHSLARFLFSAYLVPGTSNKGMAK